MYVTAKLLRSWGACWDDRRIAEHALAAGASPRQIAADESISLDDRLWVLTRCIWHLDESEARYYAIDRARSITHLAGDEDDQAQYEAILSELCRIESEVPKDQRAAARDAAWAAARDAAWDAARVAARDAARDAARAAARDAARDAAWDAAWDAARDATRAAAWAAAWVAARDAARDAARAAARDAARAAAWDAAWDAARAAAWDAARAAAWAAARDAARDAALRESIAAALEWLGDEAGEVA